MYKDAVTGSLFLVLCNYLTMPIYGGQRTGSGGFRQGLYLKCGILVEDPRLEGSCTTGDTAKNARTRLPTEGRGGAHADSPRWQEKGNSSSLSADSDPFPAVVQEEAALLQTAVQ